MGLGFHSLSVEGLEVQSCGAKEFGGSELLVFYGATGESCVVRVSQA